MSTNNWYWIDGTPYCPSCVDCDTPAADAADCTRGPSGGIRCACCHETDAPRLMDYFSGEDIRVATDDEIDASLKAVGGVIRLAKNGTIVSADDPGADDARHVYVEEA